MIMRTSLLVLAVAGVVGCEPPEGPNTSKSAPANAPAAAPATPAPAKSGASGANRALTPDARAAMKQQLGGESAGKKAWILSQPGNSEVAALVTSLSEVFKDAGWDVQADTVTGMSLKPGLMTLVAEEQYPPYVDGVLKALEASGLDAKSASGYRGYYDSKKQENPNWPGVPIRADQDFVIVVGPKPTA
jgi:hypothetical protein